VIISIDTLRADHLGAYGHPWVETPAIDALADESVRFQQAIAPAPTTLASHTSLMTGTHPHTHGVPDNEYRVAESNRMLAEVLHDAGFTTAGVIGGYPLCPQTRFNQGFDSYRVLPSEEPNSAGVSDAALSWLDGASDGRFFLFVHYWDVHWPYSPPPPYDRMYRTDGLDVTGLKTEIDAVRGELRRGEPGAVERSDALHRLYAGGVTWVDSQVGRLLEGLRERDLMDASLVVLTSDHGETMAEHPAELWNHGHTVYDSVIRVPLLLRLPGGAGGGRGWQWRLSTIDLMPSLVELLGLPVPEGLEGASFASALAGEEAWVGGGSVFAEATKPYAEGHEARATWVNAGKCRGMWQGQWKVQHCPRMRMLELFDLEADPHETVNLLGPAGSPADRSTGQRMAGRLTAWSESAAPLETVVESSPEVIERLRALGYLEE
jgi:arylsulfatase A-like enzyme